MDALSRGVVALALLAACAAGDRPAPPPRPNILWITADDLSPNLGCWGDAYARTPNLDRLATQGVRYTHAFATAPVCSPARSCLITGLYATTLGTQRLRSDFPIPDGVRGFPAYLREAGYFCTNNVKTDYNTSAADRLIRESWDQSSERAHWRARPPGRPFFSVFNFMTTHQTRTMSWTVEQFRAEVQSLLPPGEIHDPAGAPVPPYYPDTPVIRRTLARYYDCISLLDRQVGELLGQLEADGLADDTIVFFFSDHGAGLPRHKRVLHDSGLRVPLLIRWPSMFARRGTTADRLVSFVDFAPTVLSLAGVPIPELMQGTAFLGPHAGPPRRFVAGARDRVDEADDLARSVRDRRFLYIRNYLPQLSWAQPSAFSDQGEIQQEISRLAREGRLSGAALAYAGPTRPPEELYDTEADPHQTDNLAGDPEHGGTLRRLRRLLDEWIVESRDIGFLPEPIARARGSTPYDLGRSADLSRVVEAASPASPERRLALMDDPDDAVRYWAAVGSGSGGPRDALRRSLADSSPSVRVAAAHALARRGEPDAALPVLVRELGGADPDVALMACRAIELLGETARPARPAMASLFDRVKDIPGDRAMFLRFSSEAFLNNGAP